MVGREGWRGGRGGFKTAGVGVAAGVREQCWLGWVWERWHGVDGEGGGACSFVVCLSNLTTDHASLSRRRTVPTRNRNTSNVWALITFVPYIA